MKFFPWPQLAHLHKQCQLGCQQVSRAQVHTPGTTCSRALENVLFTTLSPLTTRLEETEPSQLLCSQSIISAGWGSALSGAELIEGA